MEVSGVWVHVDVSRNMGVWYRGGVYRGKYIVCIYGNKYIHKLWSGCFVRYGCMIVSIYYEVYDKKGVQIYKYHKVATCHIKLE